MLKGSCLCGGVQYEIDGEIGDIVHCHCPTCRKTHATAFSSVSSVSLDALHIRAGEELLQYFESSPGKKRYFCGNCGSHIYAKREGQHHYIFRMGTLDSKPNIKQAHHIWLSEKASWYDIDEASLIPRFESWAE